MLKCPHCEADYIPGALYCDACGNHLPPLHLWPPRSEELVSHSEESLEPGAEEGAEQSEEPAGRAPWLRLQMMSGVLLDLGGRASVSVGRHDPHYEDPDLDLGPYGGAEHGVSRQHALITMQHGEYAIEDLKSINNTLLNGFRLFPGQQYPLHDGDLVQFGTLVVRVLL
jgi:hypothetical protein